MSVSWLLKSYPSCQGGKGTKKEGNKERKLSGVCCLAKKKIYDSLMTVYNIIQKKFLIIWIERMNSAVRRKVV